MNIQVLECLQPLSVLYCHSLFSLCALFHRGQVYHLAALTLQQSVRPLLVNPIRFFLRYLLDLLLLLFLFLVIGRHTGQGLLNVLYTFEWKVVLSHLFQLLYVELHVVLGHVQTRVHELVVDFFEELRSFGLFPDLEAKGNVR